MPKKRHQTRYSKPQSTAPSSLSPSTASLLASRSSSSADASPSRGVNELLADLRRNAAATSAAASAASRDAHAHHQQVAVGAAGAALPSVPPSIRQILQLPETPAPAPRRALRRGAVDAQGRRLPPGPPPPRSASGRRHGRRPDAFLAESGLLPGMYEPEPDSLVDMCLRRLAMDWEFQRSYNRYYLCGLPSRLRAALIRYVGVYADEGGVDASDLRALLLPVAEEEEELDDDSDNAAGSRAALWSISESLNRDLHHLDVSGSIGHSLTVKELSDLLFPSTSARRSALLSPPAATVVSDIQESWEDDSPAELLVLPLAPPAALLPNLTHLSLAIAPGHRRPVSWKHLLSLAGKLPTLTHLSLAYWPEPSLTPNAKYSAVVSAQGRTVQYGGTGPYSHSLDDDWSEAVVVLRKLSRHLYGLEHLDLTGCAGWFEALRRTVDDVAIDWTTHWGKVATLVLRAGTMMTVVDPLDPRPPDVAEVAAAAERVERHIVAQRAGKGRFITVDRDKT